MPAVYTVQPLPPDRVDQAYPLVHAIEPGLAPAAWRRLCARSSGSDHPDDQVVLMVTAATQRFYGLCTVEILRESGTAAALVLTRLILGRTLDLQYIGEVLLLALVDYARQRDCGRLRIARSGTDEPALRILHEAGALLQVGLPIEVV